MSAIRLNNFGADQKASVYKDQIVPLHSKKMAIGWVYQYQVKGTLNINLSYVVETLDPWRGFC